jgi:hypothetical protein
MSASKPSKTPQTGNVTGPRFVLRYITLTATWKEKWLRGR